MKQWIGGATPAWRDDQWQVYALPGPEVAELAERFRPVLEAWPNHLAPVHRPWLHMTVQPTPWWAADVSEDDVQRLHASLRDACSELAPVTLTVGPGIAGSVGPLLDVDGPWSRISARVADVVSEVTGAAPATSPPHVSLGYCRADLDVRGHEQLASRLRRVRGRAQWTVDRLHLVRVHQDAHEHSYTWTEAREIPLGE